MFGDSWWAVRIDNASNAVTTIVAGDVKAIDVNGIEVPDGCRQANYTMPVDQWQRTDTGQPERMDKQPPMGASADDIVTAARYFSCYGILRRSQRTRKGWR